MDPSTASKARHDVRTLLNHIAGYSDLLRADSTEIKNTELANIFGSIFALVAGLKEALNELLAGKAADEGRRAATRSAILSQLFDVISLGHSAKRVAKRDDRPEFLGDIEKILKSADKIVDMMENPLEVETTAPAVQGVLAKRRSGAGPSDLGKAANPGRILIVDDDDVNRQIMSRQLERQGHVAVSTETGAEALKLLKRVPFDLIILDVMMPGMSGFEVLEKLKADERLRETPVIVISALEDPSAMAACIEMGAEDYLPREYDPIILRARIGSIMERARLKRQKDSYVKAIEDAQKRLQTELSDAAKYVSSLLPAPILSGPVRVAWSFIPSLSLGGDIFGYHSRPDGRFALYLIDVSGHGIEAALLSVTIMNMLKGETLPGTDFSDPADVLSALNRRFRSEDQNNMYFTIWYGVYDQASRQLSYSSGGNSAGVVIGPDGSKTPLITEGIVIGVDEDYLFANAAVEVAPGSRLYVYSDGIYEVRTKDGDVFGMDEFTDVLQRLPPEAEPRARLEGLIKLIRDLSMTGAFEDDVSLMEVSF
jgi:sigma-B regulation protein RsbU (phosphoserine phosphatase)